MDDLYNFPSKHTGLQQTFFQKSIQSDQNNKNRKRQAQSEFDEQKKRSVNILDFRLRETASAYLFNLGSSTEDPVNKSSIVAQHLVNELREKATNLYRDKLSKANACKLRIQLNRKEQDLVLRWGEINPNPLNISSASIQGQDVPETLEACAEQASNSVQKICELGDPSQYGSGRLGRSLIKILSDIFNGIGMEIAAVFALFMSVGFEKGCTGLIVIAVVLYSIALGISDWLEMDTFQVIGIMTGIILGLGGVMGGLGVFTLEDEKKAEKRDKTEKRAKLTAGYSAYLTYERAENLMQGLYEKKIRLLENQRNNDYEDATKQEQAMMLSINRFSTELGKAERSLQAALQKIETEYQQEQQELKHEFEKIRGGLTVYSKMAIAEWSDVFWQENVTEAFEKARSATRKVSGELRIGSSVYPGSDQRKVALPMLIDLLCCGHIFISATQDTEWQATQLMKSILARMVFIMPVFGAEFTFIDTKAAGIFAEYHQLPQKMGNYSYSLRDEILSKTRSLEQHQKKMQAKIGNSDFETYNMTAEEPEMRRIVCISGYPNPKRFGTEAESYLENIIQSGAKVGIHVLLKINKDIEESMGNSRHANPELYFKHSVVLQPLSSPDKWELCFNGQAFPFVPDTAPKASLIDKVIRQIHVCYASKPVDRLMKVFMCYAREDKPLVREVYERLKAESWIHPWLNEEVLLPGQGWELEIRKAVTKSDVVIVFISNNSVTKEGYVQKELRIALDVAQEKPEGMIFIIPMRLEDCSAPFRLNDLHWVDYFPPEQRDEAFGSLLRALKARYENRSSK